MQKCVICNAKCNNWKYLCNECENSSSIVSELEEASYYEDTELLVDIELLKNPSGKTSAKIEGM